MVEIEREDKIISDFLCSVGPWKDNIVIGGGYALIVYKLYLANQKLPNAPVGTRDIDALIPRKISPISQKNIATHLHEAGFVQNFKDYEHPATRVYVKEIDGFEVEIEFLTDSATRKDKNKNVEIAGVVAQPLSYLTLSLQKTMKFKTYSNEIGSVVSPGAWMFHKGLTFTRRKGRSKMLKDLYGIWYVASQLGTFSERAVLELNLLGQQKPKWYGTFQKNLHKWTENAAPIDWFRLETQDPSGNLKKLNFESIVKELIQAEELVASPSEKID